MLTSSLLRIGRLRSQDRAVFTESAAVLPNHTHFLATQTCILDRHAEELVLFEADRVHLQRRMEHATEAIHRRMEELLNDQDAGSVSERLALRNALETLADLQRIAYARKPSGSVMRESGRGIGG